MPLQTGSHAEPVPIEIMFKYPPQEASVRQVRVRLHEGARRRQDLQRHQQLLHLRAQS